MSLFAGVVFADNPEHVIESQARLYKALKDFRPDPLRVWRSESAVLLSSTWDRDMERCPLTVPKSGRDDVAILATSRLDYPEQLAQKLGAPYERADRDNPRAAEILLAKAYLRWGEACVEHLDGDFAFAILDRREGRIFAARDRLGVFPFYYYRSRSGFYFANNMRILRSAIGSRPLNLILMVNRIQGFEQATHLTMLESVFRLPAGSALQCNTYGEPSVRRYWSCDDLKGEASDDFDENAARLRTLLVDSTKRRLPAEGNVGAHLSGGLDSTAIAGAAALSCRDRLHSYSAVFPGIPAADNSALIEIATRHLQIRNETFEPMKLDILTYFDNSLQLHGDFFFVFNIHMMKCMLELAERDNCRTMLNGEDGDTVVSAGTHRLLELAAAGRWWEFGKCAKAVGEIYAGVGWTSKGLYNALGRPVLCEKAAKGAIFEMFWAPLALSIGCGIPLQHSMRQICSYLLHGPRDAEVKRGIFNHNELNHGTLDAIGYGDQISEMIAPKPISRERDAQTHNFSTGLYETYFEIAHSLSAKHGISTRSPFMDVKLIEFCLAVPAEHKLRNGWTRAFLRHGMGDVYPAEIAWQRKKSNLSGGLNPTIGDRCAPAIEAKLGQPSDAIWQFFEPQRILGLVNKAKTGHQRALEKIWIVRAVSICLSTNQDITESNPQCCTAAESVGS